MVSLPRRRLVHHSRRSAIIAVSVVVLSGCGLKGESQKWRNQLQETTAAIERSVNSLALAVPGERYLRLIDAVHSGTPEEREQAQRVVQSLFLIDIDQPFEVSIWWEFDGTKRVRADFFQASAPVRLMVDQHCRSRSLNLTPVGSPSRTTRTQADVRAAMIDSIKEVLDDFVGPPQINVLQGRMGIPVGHTVSFPDAMTSPRQVRDGVADLPSRSWVQGHAARLRSLAERLVDGILLAYHGTDPVEIRDPAPYSKPWSVMNPAQVLFVLIPDEDWDIVGAEIKITAVVHQAGDKDSTFQNSRVYTFLREEFENNDVYVCDNPNIRLRWAAHNMTNQTILSETQLQNLEDLRKAIEAWEKLDK